MSSGYCTKLGTEHCSIIRIVLCGTTFTLLKKRCQCFVDAPMLRSHRRQRPLTDNKEKPQPHYFVNVGPSLADNIPDTDTQFSQYLSASTNVKNSLFLNPVTDVEILQLVAKVKPKSQKVMMN